jgi:hypothetical protein
MWPYERKGTGALQYSCHIYSVVDPKTIFYPDPDPIFLWFFDLDLDPDPTWPVKSCGSSSGSDPKYSLFHNTNDYKSFFHGILKHSFQ